MNCVKYRGPDAEGFFINKEQTVGLAHVRLSIIDLSTDANQPMSSLDGSVHIVFNGEIYNYQVLKKELEKKGYLFKTNSDTEVLINSYLEWDENFLEKINGMFAFGIYDSRKNRILIARDRIGKKPLFYSYYKENFLFASELKSIYYSDIIPVEIEPKAVNFYFSYGYIPGELSILKSIYKLKPAHFLIFDITSKSIKIKNYWEVPEFREKIKEERAIEELESLIEDSVKIRLISDVPLGSLLSGGIDSSLVTAFMTKITDHEVMSFNVDFQGSSKSEAGYAKIVSSHLKTQHHNIVVSVDYQKELEYVSGQIDEPIYDSSLLLTYILSKYVKDYVKVVLSGDGGDENFGGYIHYHSALIAKKLGQLSPPPLKYLAGMISQLLPEGFFGKNTLYGIAKGSDGWFLYPTQIFKEEERKKLFKRDFLEEINIKEPFNYRKRFMDRNYDFISQMCFTDLKTMLVDDILVKVDRASMMNSIEVRCPLLDYRIVEFSFSYLSGNLRIKNGIKKYLLKQIAKKYLPPDFPFERKQGFDIPKDLIPKNFILERILSFDENEFLEKSYILKLVKGQKKERRNLWTKIFAIYFFLRWMETWRK
ncbi:asparagine synthase (glutamine-hydrolyzing) [Thermodesulfovibrio hydrogeniphilus]